MIAWGWLSQLAVTVALTSLTAQSFDPAYRFQILNTPHFAIHFHQGEAADAVRLALIAEETWLALDTAFDARPPAHTDVLLVDQTEDANGWATPVPRPTVMVTATWPSGVEFIGSTDDWLRLVFTHEFTHIAHLDRSRGWSAVVRATFGRLPLAFPNTWLPAWQIEGLATFEESALTGEGRLHAGDFRAIIDQAAAAHALTPIDRVNGGVTAWPAGLGPYAYGVAFHEYLAARFGQDSLARLTDATAKSLPYLWGRAFAHIYGGSPTELWQQFQASLAAAAGTPASRARLAAAETDHAVRLTRGGFAALAPRISATPCPACPAVVRYAARDPHGFPGTFEVPLDGAGQPRRLFDRFLGTTTASAGEVVYFDQQELQRNAGLYSGLYAWSRDTQQITRLSSGGRFIEPDLSPDGHTLVAIRVAAGERRVVIAPVGRDRDLVWEEIAGEDGTQFNAPRWSPDGHVIAAERHRRGGYSEIVLIDVATHEVRTVASTPAVRWVTPAWTAGGTAVVAAADLDEGPFNLYEVTLDGSHVRQLTHTAGGATWPDVSSDGRTLVYVGYTVNGFDIFRMPYRAAEDRTALVHRASDTPAPHAPPPAGAAATVRAYTPWPTLAPTAWTPVLDVTNQRTKLGAQVAGADVLGYHAWMLTTSWVTSQPAGTPKTGARPDVDATYAYQRWRLSPWLTASRDTSFFGVAPASNGLPVAATVRERRLEAGATLPMLRVRRAASLQVSLLRAAADLDVAGTRAVRTRAAVRGALALRTARIYGYSISPERGVALGATGEWVRRALGADADAQVVTADGRVYLPGLARHHVVAVRLAGGASTGVASSGRTFLMGGGAAAPGVASTGSEAFSLLRGFAADSFAGTRAALVNVEYRLPLWRPERGAGILPVLLHTAHAAAFFDAGHTWTQTFASRDAKIAAGAELSADVVLGYWLPLTVTVGAAHGHDGSGLVRDGWQGYIRIGRAF